MKKTIILISSILLAIALFSCTEDEFLLKNKWQLREYRRENGTVTKVDSVYYSFQKGSFMALCLDKNTGWSDYYGTYTLAEGKLNITMVVNTSGPMYDKFFGWTDAHRTFQIEELSSSKLQLNYEGTQLVFRKY